MSEQQPNGEFPEDIEEKRRISREARARAQKRSLEINGTDPRRTHESDGKTSVETDFYTLSEAKKSQTLERIKLEMLVSQYAVNPLKREKMEEFRIDLQQQITCESEPEIDLLIKQEMINRLLDGQILKMEDDQSIVSAVQTNFPRLRIEPQQIRNTYWAWLRYFRIQRYIVPTL